MFKRSRKNIIISIMGSLILLFVITLSVIMMASYREIWQRNAEMLERYVQLYSLENQPGEQNQPESGPQPGEQNQPESGPQPGTEIADEWGERWEPPVDGGPDFLLSTFYSVAVSDTGRILAVDKGEKDVYSEDELIEIANEVLKGNKKSGNTGNLFYMIRDKGEYTLAAFLDNTVSEYSMNTLLRNFLLIGGAAIVVLFFFSLYLSHRIIKPLEENDRKQKQFISDAGHELKTPVAVISANTELLSKELGENEWLSNIRYENERMGGLIKQLLYLSRTETVEIPMEEVDLSRIVTGEVLAFESLAFEQGKVIHSEIEENIHVTGRASMLEQLTCILLDNAFRHSTGSDIGISLTSQAHMAILEVSNDGNEIPAEKLEHLFDRFYRVDEARTGEGEHYGLGLSIAKTITEKHRGKISVSSDGGKVRFVVTVPGMDWRIIK